MLGHEGGRVMLQLENKLEPNGVAAPAQRAAWQCSEIVAFCLVKAHTCV
jgi:hypothetical protein